ncbi:MAG: S-methyl-5-thioribose-1-phosphate isomerase [Candidatus Marinimicrobia bacterium]|nr:S-methyl-5-thioribose-1-phosphate isomerase [Candidatus Neomarinimicrobiota bacterium]|tara:strand:- start:3799 stop:4854 length:1056 start_codon:yes stop_codon:yes gene_type:complete
MKTLINPTPTIEWKDAKVRLIDQTKLPLEEKYIETDNYKVVCDAIYRLAIRGAPAIGVAGAYACVLAANKIESFSFEEFINEFLCKADEISATRPTAINLLWAVKQLKDEATNFSGNIPSLKKSLLDLANNIKKDDIYRCHNLSLHGAKLIPDNSNVITICNTGGLATSGIGTALGVIQYAHAQGKNLKVHVCETRPLLQGSRLNTWELKRTKTPFTLMTDSMAARAMKKVHINGVFVGADRIASNGDTANKIGTYSLAVLANHHNIPFYVAAPLSTVDYEIESGSEIPVEKRSADEVTRIKGIQFTVEDIDVSNPAFDVTPGELINGIITEKGIAKYPFKESLKKQRNEN